LEHLGQFCTTIIFIIRIQKYVGPPFQHVDIEIASSSS